MLAIYQDPHNTFISTGQVKQTETLIPLDSNDIRVLRFNTQNEFRPTTLWAMTK